jgi:hypothetical protein
MKKTSLILVVFVAAAAAAFAVPSTLPGDGGWSSAVGSIEYGIGSGRIDAGTCFCWRPSEGGALGFGLQVRLNAARGDSFPVSIYLDLRTNPLVSPSPELDMPLVLRAGIDMSDTDSGLWMDAGAALQWLPVLPLYVEGLTAVRVEWHERGDGATVAGVAGLSAGGAWTETGGGGVYYYYY